VCSHRLARYYGINYLLIVPFKEVCAINKKMLLFSNIFLIQKRKSTKLNYKFLTELGNQSQSNQSVVINLNIDIHIRVIITFFPLFHGQVIFKSFAKKKAIF